MAGRTDLRSVVFGVAVSVVAATMVGVAVAAGLWSPQLEVLEVARYAIGQSIPAWIALALAGSGTLAAALSRREDAAGYYLAIALAISCAVVGLASASFVWIEAEVSLPGLTREMASAYSARETRILFAAPAYVAAALHLAIGAAGTAAIVGVLLLRRRA
ncbi:hypothetical protein [Brevundimonas sp. Root1279]|uniref:hypothetical protein n=1 Tax=Brevundimonas sp. Root1279 TaxID=1736443 RepID=UPI0006FD3DC7|nr:hypothetical protein [Brevundimonas sp. Root1279]KQW86505.1 hypothetical protein ASC65_00990 [Brevundimonas sp. Root1279]